MAAININDAIAQATALLATLNALATGGTVPPVVATTPPVVTVPPAVITHPSTYPSLGTAIMDGSRLEGDLGPGVLAVATLIVPSGLPTSKSNLSVFGNPDIGTWWEVWFSKTYGDLATPYHAKGEGVNIYFSVGGVVLGGPTLQAGETWYIHVKNTGRNDAGLGIKVYKP